MQQVKRNIRFLINVVYLTSRLKQYVMRTSSCHILIMCFCFKPRFPTRHFEKLLQKIQYIFSQQNHAIWWNLSRLYKGQLKSTATPSIQSEYLRDFESILFTTTIAFFKSFCKLYIVKCIEMECSCFVWFWLSSVFSIHSFMQRIFVFGLLK